MSTDLRDARATRRAWVAAAFIPVGFVVAMVVGEGLLALQGYDSADDHAPAGAVALAGGTGILVFLGPCIVTWILGRRAAPQGNAPAAVAAVAGVGFVLLNLVGLLGRIAGL